MSTVPAPTKTPTVTITLTVTRSAPDNMTIAELTKQTDEAKRLVSVAKEFGTVTGHIAIGKQKYSLED